MKQPRFFLQLIHNSINDIEQYVAGITINEFISDSMRYNATIKQIENIGEAIKKLESNFTDSYPDIPWNEIKAMRNILIHEYWQTDLEEVYKTATIDIPNLKSMLDKIPA